MAREFYGDLDMNKNELIEAVFENLASDPLNPDNGQIYYNTVSNSLRYFNGTIWVELVTGGASSFENLTDTTFDFSVSTALPADDGKIVFFDKESGAWITDDAITHGTSIINGKTSVGTGSIPKGLPVYISGFDSDLHIVELADANGAGTFPVAGFTAEPFDSTNSKHIITFGKLTGVDTTNTVSTLNPNGETWLIGDILYISTTTGGLTKTRPTGGTTAIQRVAKVLRVDASGGQLFIFNTFRTAGVPNLPTNQFSLGDTNGNPQSVEFTKEVSIQEFFRTEILEVREGLITWVVPSSYDGYKITEFVALTFNKNDNVTLRLLNNGTTITNSTSTINSVNLLTGSGSVTNTTIDETLSTDDVIQVETTVIGATPSEGLVVSMILKKY